MSFQIWAIINLTPDSFYQHSRFTETTFLPQVEYILNCGADMLDIGAESTRPFSRSISIEEEWRRLKTPLKSLKKEYGDNFLSKRVSIDTRKSEIAERSIELGAGTINDTSGLSSLKMIQLLAKYQKKVVIMHSQGKPSQMQVNPNYKDLISEILNFLKSRSITATKNGVLPKNIIWDYGIGFGKTVEHNLMLLKNIKKFKSCGYPLMVGLSRKSFIGKILKLDNTNNYDIGSLVLHTFLALQDIDILRVHDVKETNQMRLLLKKLQDIES